METGLAARFKRWQGIVLACLFASSPGRPALGEEPHRFDLQDWLTRPGVQLVAVEFYATHCKPCMDAVPRWQKLHERYRAAGLRLLVVSVQDPDATICARLSWRPEEAFCDLDGGIADRFRVQALPAAFLWTWQGKLLVQRGHVQEVEKAVETWLANAPRVLVEAFDASAGADHPDAGLRQLLEVQLGDRGKVTVVANEAEREQLRVLQRRSHSATRAENQSCKLGAEMAENSRLVARQIRVGNAMQLALTLQNLDTGCQLAQAVVPWTPRNPERAVADAVDRLLASLVQPLELPAGVALGMAGKLAPAPWKLETAADVAVVRFESEPPGAAVAIDGKTVCPQTPCSRGLPPGPHTLAMLKPEYLQKSAPLTFKNGDTVRWKLDENYGEVAISTVPPGIAVAVDDLPQGDPHALRLSPGAHHVSVHDPCFEPAEQQIDVRRGKPLALTITLVPRVTHLQVLAMTTAKAPVATDVWVDNVRIGKTQAVLSAPLCAKLVELRHPTMGVYRREDLKLVAGKSNVVRFALEEGQAKGPHGIVWIREPGDQALPPFLIAKTETTVAQYKACVDAGGCTPPERSWGPEASGSGDPDRFKPFRRNWEAPKRGQFPINDVSPEQAAAFCQWVGGRLPTDPEWTFAATSAGRGSVAPWGSGKATCARAVMSIEYPDGGYSEGCATGHTVQVCSKRAGNTAQGVCDMFGNVWEMVGDATKARGGSATSGEIDLESSYFGAKEHEDRRGYGNYRYARRAPAPKLIANIDLGIRCAKSAPVVDTENEATP